LTLLHHDGTSSIDNEIGQSQLRRTPPGWRPLSGRGRHQPGTQRTA